MDNCVSSTRKILDVLQIRHTETFVYDSILSHPDYPSLLAVSDTLEKYKIDVLAIKIDTERLAGVPLPCIVQVMNQRNPLFYIITKIDTDTITYYDENNKVVNESKNKFLEKWTGICLLTEKTENSKEPNIEESIAKKKVIHSFVLSIGALLLAWLVFTFIQIWSTNTNTSTATILYITYTALKIVGLATAVFLLWYEVDKYNPTLQNLCSGGKKVNCGQVLNSKHAHFFNGTINISALAFGYFFASLLLVTIAKFSASVLSIVSVLSLVAIPVILYSVYTQAFLIKKWCKFCIVVLAVLFAESILVYFIDISVREIKISDVLFFVVLFLAPIVIWILLKPILEKGKEANLFKRSLKKIKNNKTVFDSLHAKADTINTSLTNVGILLKNENPKYHIVKVCNPYCGPCAKAHPVLDELYHKGLINLQIIFTAEADEKDVKYKPVSHFLAVASVSPKKTAKALDDWYMADNKDYEAFARKYPMNGELEQQKEKIQKMKDWCNAENITHTPTIFINGYKLAKEYSIEDLKEVVQ